MTDEKSAAPARRRQAPQLSPAASARRAAFETVSGEREWCDRTAREVLDARSVEREWGGRWPCYVGHCYDGTDKTSILHDPASLTLLHASRAREHYRAPDLKSVRDTDRAPVCRHCRNLLRDFVMWDD